MSEQENQQTVSEPTAPPEKGPNDGQIRNPVTIILLSIITCGIYALYWYWVTKDQINKLADKEIIGSGLLILSFFCFPIILFVWYKWDQTIQDISKQKNVGYSSNFILWVILAAVVGFGNFVMMFQIQDTLNRIYGGD